MQSVSNIISSMLGYILNEGENAAINKVVTATKGLFPEQNLSKAVCQAVVYLLKDEDHIKILETKEKVAWYDQVMNKFGQKKDELISKLTNIENIENDDTQAITDSSFILC